MFLVAIDLKMFALACGFVCNRLVRQVNLHLCLMVLGNALEQLFKERFRNHYWQNKVVEFVVLVNVGKEAAYHHAEPISRNGPCCVLTRGARTEVLTSHKNDTTIRRVVKHEIFFRCSVSIISPVAEEVIAHAFLVCGFKETRWYDLVCIYVFKRKGYASACYDIEFLFHRFY